jgi:multidrug efflux pump
VAYRNNAPVRLSDPGNVSDSVEDVRNIGIADGKPTILIIVSRQPGANIIDTVDSHQSPFASVRGYPPADHSSFRG